MSDTIYLYGNYQKSWEQIDIEGEEPFTESIFVHRIPKSWILQEDAKIKDELLLLDEIIEM